MPGSVFHKYVHQTKSDIVYSVDLYLIWLLFHKSIIQENT